LRRNNGDGNNGDGKDGKNGNNGNDGKNGKGGISGNGGNGGESGDIRKKGSVSGISKNRGRKSVDTATRARGRGADSNGLEYFSEIDYTALFQKHMRGMVRDVLEQVAADGLPGEHHFYVTFLTDREEVKMPEYLRARYPENMTIVIQHQFRDLIVRDTSFELCLSFGGKFEYLSIPYGALVRFTDPQGGFDLPLLPDEQEEDDDQDDMEVTADQFMEEFGGLIDLADPSLEYFEKHNPHGSLNGSGSGTDVGTGAEADAGVKDIKGHIRAEKHDHDDDNPPPPKGGKVIKVDFGRRK
jgi:hypothetical protein